MTTNDGGPAFPARELTLRDWFAGTAPSPPQQLNLTSANYTAHEMAAIHAHEEAAWRYAYADAMLAEREKGNE